MMIGMKIQFQLCKIIQAAVVNRKINENKSLIENYNII